jgi:hypothetical protein
MVICLIIRERKGFTAILANIKNLNYKIVALINSLYSKQILLRTYSIVLLFASKIEIAKVLLYA